MQRRSQRPTQILQSLKEVASMTDRHSEWHENYRQTILEGDSVEFAEQAASAEEAVFLRMQELRTGSDRVMECQAIEDAIRLLSVLKREILKNTIALETQHKLRQVALITQESSDGHAKAVYQLRPVSESAPVSDDRKIVKGNRS